MSAAVRRLQHDSHRVNMKRSSLLPDKWGIQCTKKLDHKITDLIVEGSADAFGSAIGRALVSMFPKRVVEVDLLFGGRSGSLVLTAKVKSSDGLRTRTETNCVIKVDKEENLKEEEESTEKILKHLGENAPRVLCGGAHYEELGSAVALGSNGVPKRSNITTIGVFAIELVGACWVSPEFSEIGGKLVCTFQE